MTSDKSTISDLALERYHLAELPPDQAAEISHRAAIDADCRARLASLAQSDAEIREQYPDGWLAGAVLERAARERAVRPPARVAPVWIGLTGAAALIVAAVALVPGLPWRAATVPAASSPPSGNRIKGEAASLMLYRRVGSSGELLANGEAARTGDLIRVAYRCDTPRFGVIVSIDGRGVVTRHMPVDGSAAAALQPGPATLLDRAYELDDAPRWERFFLITGETAFDVQVVIDAARGAAATASAEPPVNLSLPAEFQQSSFLLRKIS